RQKLILDESLASIICRQIVSASAHTNYLVNLLKSV
ncbi:hypothetical protein SAMN05216203_3060, partial [Marinobacter daqiaonensis]